ncbi:MAG: hypothetical protein QW400_01015 [Candidatus Diapherotrites archaeon]
MSETTETDKGLRFLLSMGFPRKEALEIMASGGWQEIGKMNEKELTELGQFLKTSFGEKCRAVLLKLMEPGKQSRIKMAYGRMPTVNEMRMGLQSINALMNRSGLTDRDIGHLKESAFIDFLTERSYSKASEVALGRIFESRIKLLTDLGFKKEEALTIVSTPKGTRWLMGLDKSKLLEMRFVLAQYGLESAMKTLLISSLVHGKPIASSAELGEQLKKLFLAGKRKGLSLEKTRKILEKEPHFVSAEAQRFENYLGQRRRTKTPGPRQKTLLRRRK